MISNDRFVTCSDDCTIKLFDLNTYEFIRTFNGHEDEVRGVVEISDEKIVSCSRDHTIRIWDLNSGECLEIFGDHSNTVLCLTVISKFEDSDFHHCCNISKIFRLLQKYNKFLTIKSFEKALFEIKL